MADVVALNTLLGAVFYKRRLGMYLKPNATDQQAPHEMRRYEVIVAFVYWAVPIARYTLSIMLASLWD